MSLGFGQHHIHMEWKTSTVCPRLLSRLIQGTPACGRVLTECAMGVQLPWTCVRCSVLCSHSAVSTGSVNPTPAPVHAGLRPPQQCDSRALENGAVPFREGPAAQPNRTGNGTARRGGEAGPFANTVLTAWSFPESSRPESEPGFLQARALAAGSAPPAETPHSSLRACYCGWWQQ